MANQPLKNVRNYSKIVVQFETASILHIGDGNEYWYTEPKNKTGEKAEFSVAGLLVNRNNQPFISGTSLAGATRHFLSREVDDEFDKSVIDKLFGNSKNHGDGEKSKIFFNDSSPLVAIDSENLVGFNGSSDHPEIEFAEFRKRTKVNSETGTGDIDERALFTTAFVPKGYKGELVIEIYADSYDEQLQAEELIKKMLLGLELEYLRVGANTTNGAGILRITSAEVAGLSFVDNSAGNMHSALAEYINESYEFLPFTYRDAILKQECYEIILTGNFKSGFITGSDVVQESRDDGTTDVSVSLKNQAGKYILSGSSIKGLLRHECERIINAAEGTDCFNAGDGENESPVIQELFGYTVKNNGYQGKKGLVYCQDVVLGEGQVNELRKNRTPIDRFTQGVIDRMLATYKSVKPNDKIEITVLFDEQKFESSGDWCGKDLDYCKKLLELGCKHLAEGKIAIGGKGAVGNGYFDGEVQINNEVISER